VLSDLKQKHASELFCQPNFDNHVKRFTYLEKFLLRLSTH